MYGLSSSDDLNLAYHSVLPLEVHGANYCNMKLLTKQCLAPQMVSSSLGSSHDEFSDRSLKAIL